MLGHGTASGSLHFESDSLFTELTHLSKSVRAPAVFTAPLRLVWPASYWVSPPEATPQAAPTVGVT